MLNKVGVKLQILRQGSLTTVARGRTVQERPANTNAGEFVYFATKAIAGDIPNGNGDYFPWDHLLKSYATFIGRNLFLNHNSSDPRNAIGKVLDAYPVVDDQSGEKYIECLAKIDRVAHPDLARQIEAGILDSCSMGCSVESSQCSICGHTIYSDQDNRCQHMGHGLGKEYLAEMDFPEHGIKKGSAVKAFAINRGLNFTELSVVNVPAWDNAKIVQVIAQLKERVAKEPTANVVNDLEEILKMASNNLKTEAATPAAETKEPVAAAPETEASDTTNKEEGSRESRLMRIFKEKLSALDYLDLQAFMKKETSEASKAEAPVETKTEVKPEAAAEPKVEVKAEEKKEEMKAPASDMAGEKKDVAGLEKAKEHIDEAGKAVEQVLKHEEKELAEMKKEASPAAATPEATPAPVADATTTPAEPTVETAPAKTEAAKDEGRKLKAIFVAKADVKESYWVVTDDGKPILKASLNDIWGDKIAEVSSYASSPVYGEALLQRLREDGVKKVALLTNATIFTEAADQRGQVGKGEEWPSQKSVGKDQYSPAGPEGHAKMKKLPEGVDMSGGDTGAASTGPTGGKGDQYPTSKSMGKTQYKPSGNGGGPKAKTEKASAEDASGKIEVTADAAAPAPVEVAKEAAPAAAPAMDMPAEVAPPMDMPAAEAPAEGKEDMMDVSKMSDEEKISLMKQLIEAYEGSKKTTKPAAAVEKAVEKLEVAQTKEQEAAAKEAEKAAAAEAKEAEKAAKEAEKANKAEKKDEKAEAPKEEKDEKKDEKEEKSEKKDEMHKEAAAEVAPATVEVDLPADTPSERERELEAQLAQLKLEQALKVKHQKCQSIVSEMVEKDLLATDEADIQAEIANGKTLFDAKAAAFKKAIDKQCRDLLAMDDSALTAFAMTVKRVKGRNIPNSTGVLKKAFRLSFDEHTNDDAWLNDVFGNMGSQKGRNAE